MPSRSKIASAAAPAVSLYSSFMVVGRLPRLAPNGVHPADRRGDGWAVHFLDVGLPVEDCGVEGERRLIIRMQRLGERERCCRPRSAAPTARTPCTACDSAAGNPAVPGCDRGPWRSCASGPSAAPGLVLARRACGRVLRWRAAARSRTRRGTATAAAGRPRVDPLERVLHESKRGCSCTVSLKVSGFRAPEFTW